MSMDLGLSPAIDQFVEPTVLNNEHSLAVETSYNGSNIVFRLLRMETWGPALMNLGYYRFQGLLGFLNWFANMELAQRRLFIKAAELLKVSRGQRVLDIACGRGKSSFMLSCMYPDSQIVGLDLLDCQIQVARTLFDRIDNLSYVAGNATELDFPDASFDRVICVEAAFHFPDRAQFLREAYRVLRPGGRLVVVDFAWNKDVDRRHCDDAMTRVVREIWQWQDMFSISEYHRVACETGFRVISGDDWTNRVTRQIQGLFKCLSMAGNNAVGRKFLNWRNPLYRSFSLKDWKDVARAVEAHDHVQRFSKYMAFVFEKA